MDGFFGLDTAQAVERLQRAHGLAPTGVVDATAWRLLLGTRPPGVRDLALQLTAAFEGHGFGRARGNGDGAGVTWGIIGFTLKYGELARIVRRVNEASPRLVREAFGEKTDELLDVMEAPVPDQLAWADRISLGARKVALVEPWASAFARFGRFERVQALQVEIVEGRYFQPALATARRLGLRTELGLALAFDIHVQNGGIGSAVQREIESRRREIPPTRERELRLIRRPRRGRPRPAGVPRGRPFTQAGARPRRRNRAWLFL